MMNAEDNKKDEYFTRVGALTEEMVASFGRDFAAGVLILAARFVAEGKPLASRSESQSGTRETAS